MSENRIPNIAILIDAENVLPVFAGQIFSYAASLGTVTHREIYGAGIALNDWAEPILKYAIHMNMTIRPNRFKNSSDIALAVGAMDLLLAHTMADMTAAFADTSRVHPALGLMGMKRVDTVIIASSDSDFSVLSLRLRNSGMQVIGMGEEKSNAVWRSACSQFVVLTPEPAPEQKNITAPVAALPPASRITHQRKASEPAAKPAPKPVVKPAEPEPAPKAPEKKEKTVQTEKPVQAKKIAPTHSARIEIIGKFIDGQLAAHEGRMPSQALFTLLNELPDYRFDQQRSKRKPLDYLVRQFGGSFKFQEDTDGVTWIFAAAEDEPQAAAPVPEEEAASSTEEQAPAEEINGQISMEEWTETQEAPEENKEEPVETKQEAAESSEEPDPIALLTSAGVPEDHAAQIVEICNDSPNLRVAYNKLRKAFGQAGGRKYYALLKELTVETPTETAVS